MATPTDLESNVIIFIKSCFKYSALHSMVQANHGKLPIFVGQHGRKSAIPYESTYSSTSIYTGKIQKELKTHQKSQGLLISISSAPHDFTVPRFLGALDKCCHSYLANKTTKVQICMSIM